MITNFKLFEENKEFVGYEVVKFRKYLNKIILNILGPGYDRYLDYQRSGESIVLKINTYNNYFRFEFKYIHDEIKINLFYSCCNELNEKINGIIIFFKGISIIDNTEHLEWIVNKKTFFDEIDNIDQIIDRGTSLKKFNL